MIVKTYLRSPDTSAVTLVLGHRSMVIFRQFAVVISMGAPTERPSVEAPRGMF